MEMERSLTSRYYRDSPHDLLYGMRSIASPQYPSTRATTAHPAGYMHQGSQHTQPPPCRAIELVLPTIAWLIAAPPSNSARTHSTCPFWLAMYSGVNPSVCHATRRSHRKHHNLMLGLVTALTHVLQPITAILPMTCCTACAPSPLANTLQREPRPRTQPATCTKAPTHPNTHSPRHVVPSSLCYPHSPG
jgi:hypothetical protein